MDNIESICELPFAIVPFAITGTLILFTTERTKCSYVKGAYHYTCYHLYEDIHTTIYIISFKKKKKTTFFIRSKIHNYRCIYIYINCLSYRKNSYLYKSETNEKNLHFAIS